MSKYRGLKVRSHLRAGGESDVNIGGGAPPSDPNCSPSTFCETYLAGVTNYLLFKVFKYCRACYTDNCTSVTLDTTSCWTEVH